MRTWAHILVLVLLSLVVIGYNLGGNSLHNGDEAKHAVVAREAATQGHWVPLTYNGRPYFNKPPLRIWLTAITFKLVGIDEWSVRLWSGIFGLGTVLALYLLGRRIWTNRVAFLSALILLTSHQYIYNHCVRTGETDSMLIFCWTCGLLLLQLAVRQQSRVLLFASAASIGLCGMVKHLGFVPIVLLIAVGYVLLAGVWRTFPLKTWLTSLCVIAAVALPWHIVIWLKQGQGFINAYFLGEVVEKRLQPKHKSQTWDNLKQYVSLATMMQGFFPWSYLLPFALGDLVGRKGFRRDWLLPTLWLLVAVVATLISGRKYTWYILPAFPAAAILVARLLDRFLGESRSRFAQISVLLGGLAALSSLTSAATHNPFAVQAISKILSVNFLGRLRGPETTLLVALVLLLVTVGSVGLVFTLGRRISDTATTREIARYGLVLAILGLAIYTVVVPLKFSSHRTGIHRLALAAENHLLEGEPLYVVLPARIAWRPRFIFYLGTKDLRRLRVESLVQDDFSGRLVLTDRANLRMTGIEAPIEFLSRQGELVLIKWPESPSG